MSDSKTMSNVERAKKAVNERWHPTIPKATHTGILIIAGQEIVCDVLENGKRILRRKNLLKAIGKGDIGSYDQKRGESLNLPVFMTANNLTPYLEQSFREKGALIYYRSVEGKKICGYDATILPEACKIYVKAEEDNVLQKNQIKIAKVCKAMLYGLATVGIISLVDDATGFVEKRNRDELQKILEQYISEELRTWTKKFPNEFFKQVYRIHGWEYPKLKPSHPQCVGNFINKYIYKKLPPGVIDELKKRNPTNENGNRHHRHHQLLTENVGNENLNRQILQTITLMKVSNNVEQFKEFTEQIEEK
jgi:P63C domain-containing protein